MGEPVDQWNGKGYRLRTFKAFNRDFEYYPELGERTVEIPIALAAYSGINQDNVIEVGYVMARQIKDRHLAHALPNRIVDLFDTTPECENIDAGLVDYTGAFVLSISTLEHMDMPDYGNTDTGRNRGVKCLIKMLNESAGYFITWPLGYNKHFDAGVMSLGVDVFMLHQNKGPTNSDPHVLPEWEQLPTPNWSIQYGSPFHYGNAVGIISNVPWIMNHEIIHHCA